MATRSTTSKAPAKKAAAKGASAKSGTARRVAVKGAAGKSSTSRGVAANGAAANRSPAAKKTSGSRGDALALLSKDHKEVDRLFKTYAKLAKKEAGADERLEISQQICSMLSAHARIEEEIFYPALREALDDDDLIDEATVEHASAKDLIAQIESMGPDDDLYDAKVTVLGEYIRHHVEEEENEIFPKAQKARMDLAGLGKALKSRKEALIGENGPADQSDDAASPGRSSATA